MALTNEQKAARAARREMKKALEAESRAHRSEARNREWAEKEMYLSWEELIAGKPCQGCGLPVVDDQGGWSSLLHRSDKEQVEYDVAEARYRDMHAECGSHRWSISGSRTKHCGYCCPPPPISESQRATLARIFQNSATRAEDLHIWECTLTCGHTVQKSSHYTHPEPAFTTTRCEPCGMTRGVVSSEKISDAESRERSTRREHSEQIAKAEREVEKTEKALRTARHKLKQLKAGEP